MQLTLARLFNNKRVSYYIFQVIKFTIEKFLLERTVIWAPVALFL